MINFLRSVRISVKLPLVMCVVTALAIVVSVVVALIDESDQIRADTQARLQSISQLKGREVQTLVDNIDRDLTLRAGSVEVRDALAAFARAFSQFDNPTEELQRIYITDNPHLQGERDRMDSAQVKHPYARVHTKYHPIFNALQDAMGYCDVFLFNTEGNLVYSVFKEPDYATNMNTGEWRDSGLAEAFRRAHAAELGARTVFADFAPYAPSDDAPAAFMARPVFDRLGKRLSVIAYEMPLGALNGATQGITGLGDTGETFLVGDDGLMRSDSPRTAEDDILATRVENAAVARGLDGVSGLETFVDNLGHEVMGFYMPLDILGTQWVLISKQNTAELLAPLHAAQTRSATSAALLLAAAPLVSFVVPRVPTLDVVAEPLLALGPAPDTARARAADLLTRLNIPQTLWSLSPTTFSGGEQQRVNIARGFAHDYPALLLDEPTASLDPVNRDVVLELIEAAKARGAAIVGIFHDAGARAQVCDRAGDISTFTPGATA